MYNRIKLQKKHISIIVLVIVLFNSTFMFSQGGTGAPFLLFQSSPSTNAMGAAGVALPGDDTYSNISNPAQLGFFSHDNNLMISAYPGNVNLLPDFNAALTYNCFGIQLGYNLESKIGLPLSLGAGYIRQNINLGEYTRTYENGQVMGKFLSDESSNLITVGACLDYGFKIGLGITYKMVNSNLAPATSATNILLGDASTGAVDFGFLLSAPVINNYKIFDDFKTDFNVSAGYSIANLGGDLHYRIESDPLPRSTRIGFALDLKFKFKFKDKEFKVIGFEWTQEADNLLVNRDSLGFSYRSVIGDVNIMNNLILLKTDARVDTHLGFRISLLETINVMIGRYYTKGIVADQTYKTSGYEISTRGLFKFLDAITTNNFNKYVSEHIDLSFSHASISSDFSSGNFYNALNLNFRNYRIW